MLRKYKNVFQNTLACDLHQNGQQEKVQGNSAFFVFHFVWGYLGLLKDVQEKKVVPLVGILN